ncbi:MAG TPA: sugar MFS transporter [Candidatus Angelobacter sp.]|nr:sugar MFS transporter [Candidatus Angelobacter sp.]
MPITFPGQTGGAGTTQRAPEKTDQRAMAMVSTLFLAWGFLTCLNDILIPHLKNIFDLNYTEVMLVQFAFFSSYFLFSMPSGKIVEWIGYKRAMVTGLLTMAMGALLFVPAASIPSFPLFLSALIVLAAGMTVLQTSANPYVAILGPPRTASSRLNLTQAFNSLGTTLAPKFGSLLILGAAAAPASIEAMRAMGADQLHAYRIQQAASVKVPYIGLAVALVVLAATVAWFRLPVIEYAEAHGHATGSVWRRRRLVLGAVAIFVYVGAEVSIGSLMTNYFNQKEIGNLALKDAAGYLQYYWGGAMVGRFLGAWLLRKLRTQTLLGLNALAAALLVTASMLTFGHFAMWSLVLVGLFNSIMFPSIFTLAIEGLGPLTGKGSGLLVAAIVGGAIIPELQGLLADHIGIHHAFFLPVLCYAYIVFYALKGTGKREVAPG